MTHAPHTNDLNRVTTDPSDDLTSELRLAKADASVMAPAVPADTPANDLADPADEVLVDQQGRPLGPRALRTRRRILEAAVELLAEKPMRDMRVIDIARAIGSSPATFYQYFKDVEDVVLHLAAQAKESTPLLVEMIDRDWEGEAGFELGKLITTTVIDHWEKFAPVLRARNNASDEGNLALREERMAAMLPLVDAFRRAVERHREVLVARGELESVEGQIDALCTGTALSSTLERMSMYHSWIEDMGSTREALVESTATILQTMVTSTR